MKKTFLNYIVAIIVLGIVVGQMSSCKKTLDLAPEDYFNAEDYFTSKEKIESYIYGVHAQIRDQFSVIQGSGELRGGFMNTGTGTLSTALSAAEFINQDLTANYVGYSRWGNLYLVITHVNNMIKSLESGKGDITTDERSYYLGQGYGIRAWMYFFALRMYGACPIVTEPKVQDGLNGDVTQLYIARSDEKTVMNFLKEDIKRSEEKFGTLKKKFSYALWSLDATRMLKGDVYLWAAKVKGTDSENLGQPLTDDVSGDLQTSINALNSVTGYSLQTDFKDAFAYEKKGNNEIIFAISYKANEADNGFAKWTYDNINIIGFQNQVFPAGTTVTDAQATGNVFIGAFSDPLEINKNSSSKPIQNYEYTLGLYNLYEVGDTRRDATLLHILKQEVDTIGVDNFTSKIISEGTVFRKFIGTLINDKRYFSDDWPVYREADRLLLLAEAKLALGPGIASDLDVVRARAGLGSFSGPYDETAIFEERVKEFVGEGKRWFDLRRLKNGDGTPLAIGELSNGEVSPAKPYAVLIEGKEEYKLCLPIDRESLGEDPLLTQTLGY